MTKLIYLIGSLRNPAVPYLGATLRTIGFDVFDDWHGAGPEADDKWKEYEETRGRSYSMALEGRAAKHIFAFDKKHLDMADIAVLVLPAGKSGHLELGYMCGQEDKKAFILFPDGEPERWDVMYQFADGVYFDTEHLVGHLTDLLDN
jgi:hypothetical protein